MAAAAASSSKMTAMELNPRGIPRAPFVANVEDYVGKEGDVESVVKKFQETSAKYRYMELSFQQRRKALLAKIPDIEQTLSVVRFLQDRRRRALGEAEEEVPADEGDEMDDLMDDDDDDEEGKGEGSGGAANAAPMKTLFELNDTLYAEAEIEENGEVGLWLGRSQEESVVKPDPQANTMLLYPLDEAVDLLSQKLEAAKKTHDEVVEDLEWLKEQVTVMEVNFARVHNWDVKRRREKNANGQSGMLQSGKEEEDESDHEGDR